jgi:hypothetical protein
MALQIVAATAVMVTTNTKATVMMPTMIDSTLSLTATARAMIYPNSGALAHAAR